MALRRSSKGPSDPPTPVVTSTEDNPLPAAPEPAPKARGGSPLMMLLGGLGVLALAGLGLAIYSKMNAAPPEEDTAAPAVTMPRKASAAPTPAKVTMPVAKAPAKGGTPGGPATVKKVPVTALGIPPTGSTAPVIKPAVPGKPARMVPVHGVPTPVQPPPGQAGQPGKEGARNTVTIVRPLHPTPTAAGKHATSASTQVQAQLKKLWQEGANAKHSKNYAAARRAWQQALKLSPGWPGFQDAINKLPR
ncbi:MAG: hypothetical protein JO316_17475 [Abitibacteriaceae bacterium]|nr:hypothetical protein [Abditibacteriaceae bacterium]MBV9867149.1 hypothetical protein [Abditibacteriaceae bacterium]